MNKNMNQDTKQKTRLRKFIRQPDRHAGRYGEFQLTSRDLDVLELAFRYRHVTADHVRALTPGSNQQLGRRLAGLFHHGYVARYAPLDRMRFELNAGSPVMAYGLDTKGWRTLQQHGRVSEENVEDGSEPQTWRKEYTRRMGQFLQHHLAISDFHTCLELACRQTSELELGEWRQDADVQGKCTWTVTGGKKETFRVAPDAYAKVWEAGVSRNLFLELDRGTEESKRIFEKLERYAWYLNHPNYEKQYGDQPKAIRVLVVTTTEKRMNGMMEVLGKLAAGLDWRGQRYRDVPEFSPGRFWFTTADRYRLEEPEQVLGPIWATIKHREERLPLFDRGKAQEL